MVLAQSTKHSLGEDHATHSARALGPWLCPGNACAGQASR